mgnify:CR=1 FL=1
MKEFLKGSWLTLLGAVTLIIMGILTEPLVAVLGVLMAVTRVTAVCVERRSEEKVVQEMPVKQTEYRKQTARIYYSAS